MHTVIPFQVIGWEPVETETPTEGGPALARTTVKKTFSGALVAESTATLLTCVAADPAAGAGYVASEQVVGALDGREGTFVLQHGGLSGPGVEPYTFGHVVPGSGTGALAGLTGTIAIANGPEGHTLTLDYTLPGVDDGAAEGA